MESIWAENDQFIVHTLQENLLEHAKNALVEGFADEPCTCKVQPDRTRRLQEIEAFVSFFTPECSTNGLSAVCLEKETGSVAGVFYCRDFKLPLPPDFSMDRSEGLVPAINCLHIIDELYEKARPDLQIGDCVDMWLLGVHPSFQRRGVAHLLTHGAMNLLKTKSFKYVVLEASGDYSAKCARSVGMQLVASIKYADYEPMLAGEQHPTMGFWELEL